MLKAESKWAFVSVFLVVGAIIVLTGPTSDAGKPDDPSGILRKSIPDKLIVLTFDDGPASHATVVAPMLKSLGFGGSFYVCDFDSFRTTKDWYMTYRQMKAMAEDGFEIGNHTVGHGGGLANYLAMDDQLLANNVPKSTTVCWPVYAVNRGICPDLAVRGYIFGRGGHERPYRPTVDDPFDVPSFTIRDGISIETFISQAQQACDGKVVVFCFHGVPDMEHPPVSLDPATFKIMMQYLKDNQYQCIALRDMAKYIDPIKAAKLPPTAGNLKDVAPLIRVKGDKPYFGKEIRVFAFPGLASAKIVGTNVSLSVPSSVDVKTLAPAIKVSEEATVEPASGVARDFTKPQTYTVTARDGSASVYTVTVSKIPLKLSSAKEMLTFVLPGSTSTTLSGSSVGVYVHSETDVKAIAPTLTVSPLANVSPTSGTVQDFTSPRTYTVTAQDGSRQSYTVTVVKSDRSNVFTWVKAEDGNWSDASKWTNSPPNAGGQSDLVLNISTMGDHTVTNDLSEGFLLNQLNLAEKQHLTLAGKSLSFTTNMVANLPPQVRVKMLHDHSAIAAPVQLLSDVAVDLGLRTRLTLQKSISGKGGLILNCPGSDADRYSEWGILRIDNKTNTYSGGTTINGGQLFLFAAPQGLGTGPVTLNPNGDLRLENVKGISNPLNLNGGTIDGGGSFEAPITLKGNSKLAGNLDFNQTHGGMSGPGGLTQIGPIGAFGRVNAGEVRLWGVNTYTGPTSVQKGKLLVKKVKALYNAKPANWIPAKITVYPAASLVINAGGSDEFTGEHVGTLLTNLTSAVKDNGLLAGSFFGVDTSNASETVTISANISDSKGPGGGAFTFKKTGAGTLRLSGKNTYTGQTVLEGGALSVESLNSVVNGKASSSLGAPTNVENGEIVLGIDNKNGDFTIIYTGVGETTDRVINLAGKKSTVTFDQAGTGRLRFTSSFLISGYGANKTIVLKGDTTGQGEIAGNISDPYDRTGQAKTAVTKLGKGTWILSGTNSYTGPTRVAGGTLSLANARGLSQETEVTIENGATLDLSFKGQMTVGTLVIGGQKQSPGRYDAARLPNGITGTGILIVQR